MLRRDQDIVFSAYHYVRTNLFDEMRIIRLICLYQHNNFPKLGVLVLSNSDTNSAETLVSKQNWSRRKLVLIQVGNR